MRKSAATSTTTSSSSSSCLLFRKRKILALSDALHCKNHKCHYSSWRNGAERQSLTKRIHALPNHQSLHRKMNHVFPIINNDTNKSFPSHSQNRGYKVLGRKKSEESVEVPLTEQQIMEKRMENDRTPAMRQFWKYKSQLDANCILLFRIGDFFEMYYEDAEISAKLLGLQLTKRANSGSAIPMTGVPVHSLETYMTRLLRHNMKVAICDQVEKASERQSTKILERDIVRIVTPGTVTEDQLLEGNQNSFLLSISFSYDDALMDKLGLAWYDLSTGEYYVSETTYGNLHSELVRISPKEIILPDELQEIEEIAQATSEFFVTIPKNHDMTYYDHPHAIQRLQSYFENNNIHGSSPKESDSLSPESPIVNALERDFSTLEIIAAGAIMRYVQETQRNFSPRFNFPLKQGRSNTLIIDAATLKSLEIMRSQTTNTKKGSLLGAIDKTITPHGGRELSNRLGAPLADRIEIEKRLDCVEFFSNNLSVTDSVRRILRNTADVERIMQQLSIGRGKPQHLVSLATTIKECDKILSQLTAHVNEDSMKEYISPSLTNEMLSLAHEIDSAIDLKIFDGIIRKGYSEEVDEARKLKNDTKSIIAQIQKKYQEETGITSLRIKEAKHMGYTIHTTGSATRIKDEKFRLIRTYKNSARYTTDELSELVYKIEHASETVSIIEKTLLDRFTSQMLALYDEMLKLSSALAHLDVLSSLGLLANQKKYARPSITDDTTFQIKGGRHVVVENSLENSGVSFKANDCTLTGDSGEPHIWLVTGANFGGKSVFLRQNAIMLILAQMGSFVPADEATIGVTDRLFSRVGAQDNLFNDQSTFMVEMQETAHILKNATPRSFVIMDEVGRGTSVTDGLAIAQSVLEYLHNHIQCRALFATHYRELAATIKDLPRLRLHASKVQEADGKIIFTYRILPGITERSYGVHVAKMAHVPEEVCNRAAKLLQELEADVSRKIEEV